ncbi:MAG: PQQ-binding-like beta-propeller repeat protein [Acidimicrobiales bacterium]
MAGVLFVALVGVGGASARGATPAAGWTSYHGGWVEFAVAATPTSVVATAPAWRSPVLDGQVYGQPLEWSDRVYVATEADVVYALVASSGKVAWRRRVATPVPASTLPCGNITPDVGITGTPVLDPARGELFVVADEDVKGRPRHVLVGLNARTGHVESGRVVDPRSSDPAALLQRTGLTLDRGRVVFGFGGNYGDCGNYHGAVVAAPEGSGATTIFTIDRAPGEREGAVWMGGAAPVVDAKSDVWVEAGNGSVAGSGAYDDSDSVLELSPTLRLRQFFAPASWRSDNANDLDLSMAPALLANGLGGWASKGGRAFLLRAGHLGGVGHQLRLLSGVCGDDIDGGAAVVGDVVYLPCLSGVVAVRASTPSSLTVVWASADGGGPPVVVGGEVWSVGQDGVLYGLNPATGHLVTQRRVGAVATHFPTPGVGAGLLLVATANSVVAFR